jgi:uncharacterized protein
VPITNSMSKGISLKAAVTVGVAAALALPTGPAVADTQVDTNGMSTLQLQVVPDPSDKSPEEEFTDAAAVVNQYWANHFADYFGGSYTPPQLLLGTSIGIPGIYDSDVDQVPCGQDILGDDNAYYCGLGDFIAAEDDFLHYQDAVGDSFVWFVVAHEWGHAIQARLEPHDQAVQDELQADCLAGAALTGATADELMRWDNGDEQELFNALDTLADKTPWTNPDSHGDTSERVYWYNHGVVNGPNGCLPEQ